jgi:hypothetical protein
MYKKEALPLSLSIPGQKKQKCVTPVFPTIFSNNYIASCQNTTEVPYFLDKAISKAGIRVCASQKEKTSFGPVMRS